MVTRVWETVQLERSQVVRINGQRLPSFSVFPDMGIVQGSSGYFGMCKSGSMYPVCGTVGCYVQGSNTADELATSSPCKVSSPPQSHRKIGYTSVIFNQ